MHRREFLTSSGALSVAFLGPLTTPDGRQDDLGREDGYPVPPDHITDIRADLDELRAYQPKLYYDHLGYAEQTEAQSDVRGMFGWTAESSKYDDVTAHYYWVRSNTQRSALYYLGIDASFLDSHYTDHEPIIVFVDNETGGVDSVVTSGGHHFVLPIDGDVGHFTEDRVDGQETHINLLVVRPHNHFMHAPLGVEGTFVQDFGAEFGSWLEQRETWYNNGRYHSTSYEAVEDPFSFYAGDDDPRQYWWREDTRDAWFARMIYIPLGLTQGDSRDELRFE